MTHQSTTGRIEAAFNIISNQAISVTVPNGALKGKIKILAPGGTAAIPVPFIVVP